MIGRTRSLAALAWWALLAPGVLVGAQAQRPASSAALTVLDVHRALELAGRTVHRPREVRLRCGSGAPPAVGQVLVVSRSVAVPAGGASGGPSTVEVIVGRLAVLYVSPPVVIARVLEEQATGLNHPAVFAGDRARVEAAAVPEPPPQAPRRTARRVRRLPPPPKLGRYQRTVMRWPL